jgi:hypothetical protein
VGAIPFYFLTRLQVDAGKFFFFYLTLLLSTVNFSNLLRMFAYYVDTLDDCKPSLFSPYFHWTNDLTYIQAFDTVAFLARC